MDAESAKFCGNLDLENRLQISLQVRVIVSRAFAGPGQTIHPAIWVVATQQGRQGILANGQDSLAH